MPTGWRRCCSSVSEMSSRFRLLALAVVVRALLPVEPAAAAADLLPRTIAAFDRYVKSTEARLAARSGALWVDGLDERQRRLALAELQRGVTLMERLESREDGRRIEVPDGLIHHWIGTAFIAGGTAAGVTAVLQEYDRHAEIFAPRVERSKLLARQGDQFTVFLRFVQKKVITVVVNSEHEARFTPERSGGISGRVVSTRIAEVDDAGEPGEHELPVGHDGGYLWRLNTYWRVVERDGGVYVQCESVTLTRGIPLGFGWLVGPFVTSIPRESLAFTMERLRDALRH